MKFRLVEKIEEPLVEEQLLEATKPMYREMLFNILEALADMWNQPKLKRLLHSERSNIEFHHIDGEYELKGLRKQAKNNSPTNLALLTKNAHNKITQLNRKVKTPEEKIKNFNLVKQEYEDEIFDLQTIFPEEIIDSIADAVPQSDLTYV